jgi:hypothetical protein
MKSRMLVISIVLALFSCATKGSPPKMTTTPEVPAVEEAMDSMAEGLSMESDQVVAVFSFAERGIGPTLLGEYVAEKLMMALSANGRIELVERNRLDAVSQEQKLGATGLIDDATAASIGNIAGAQAALVGTLTRFEDCWELTARLLGTSDARVLAMAEARFSAEGVPPNLAGQPIASRSAPVPAQSQSIQQRQASAPAEARPVDHPSGVQATPAQAQPPLNIKLKRCLETTDPNARRRCFLELRALIMTGPPTPRKAAARKCLEMAKPQQRIRCLKKVLGEAPR